MQSHGTVQWVILRLKFKQNFWEYKKSIWRLFYLGFGVYY